MMDGEQEVNLKNSRSVERWLREKLQGASVTIDSDGTVVKFYNGGIGDAVSKARDRGKNRDINNRKLFARLEEVIEKSVYFDFRTVDEKHKGYLRGQDIYQSFMKAGDNYYRVELVLNVTDDSNVQYKGHQAYQTKIEPAVYHTKTESEDSAAYARTSSNFTISLADLMEGVKPKEPEVLLDENGEPIFSDIPNQPETGGKPKAKQEQPNTAQAQSRSENQGGFSRPMLGQSNHTRS